MKKIWKSAFVVFAFAALTACGGSENTTETETTEQVDTEMETDMEMEDDMEVDTTTVQDTTVNDGVADEIEEEVPPVQ